MTSFFKNRVSYIQNILYSIIICSVIKCKATTFNFHSFCLRLHLWKHVERYCFESSDNTATVNWSWRFNRGVSATDKCPIRNKIILGRTYLFHFQTYVTIGRFSYKLNSPKIFFKYLIILR